MDATSKRQLTIKTGVVKRLTKEEKTYIKEAEVQRERVKKEEEKGDDEWNIKKQKEVLQDCLQMIPDCKKRLTAAVADLQNIVDGLDAEAGATPEAEAAREALTAAAESETAA